MTIKIRRFHKTLQEWGRSFKELYFAWFARMHVQGMVDGSASKPALRQDTGYMVEKTYLDIAPYLGAFGAYLMPQ